MIYNVCINGTAIIGYDVLAKAKHKAKEFLIKYPEDNITVEWIHYTKGMRGSKEVLEIGEGDS